MYHHHQLSAQIFRFRRYPQLNEKQIFGPNNVTEAHHILLLDNTEEGVNSSSPRSVENSLAAVLSSCAELKI